MQCRFFPHDNITVLPVLYLYISRQSCYLYITLYITIMLIKFCFFVLSVTTDMTCVTGLGSVGLLSLFLLLLNYTIACLYYQGYFTYFLYTGSLAILCMAVIRYLLYSKLHPTSAALVTGLLLGALSVAVWRPRFSCTIPPLEEELGSPPTTRRQLYVGVMTARKLLHTRAAAINRTWGKYAPKLEFYVASTNTSTRTEQVEPLPLIHLPGISDGYPPLAKFFRVLRYIAEHYIEEYNWFMRADDDCYVRMPELLGFLSQLDPSQNLYIGAPGHGRPEDLDKIQLYTNELYCLGGPGTLFSRALLKKLAPHLEECLAEATSYHDDAEVGKCISRRIGVQCTSSDEMSQLFYHDYSNGSQYRSNKFYSRKEYKALTYHPVKDPTTLFQLHQLFTKRALVESQRKTKQLREEIQRLYHS